MKDNIWHVFPVDDEPGHSLESEWKTIEFGYIKPDGSVARDIDQWLICKCSCKPSPQEQENGSIIVIHNSFDGREGLEWINEILKK